MKKLRHLIGVVETIFDKSSTRDKKFINMLAIMIPISALIAGGAFGSFVYFFSELSILSIGIGLFAFLVILWHDQSLLSTDNTAQIYARIAASLLIALFITIPFKATQMESAIKEKLIVEANGANSDVYLEMNAKIEEIEKKGEELNDMMIKTAENRDTDQQAWYEARRALKAFNLSKTERIKAIKKAYEGKVNVPEISKYDIMGYYAKNMFSTDRLGELFTNLALIVFLLFVEASPAIVRLGLQHGEYIEERDHHYALKKTVRNQIKELEKQVTQDRSDIAHLMFKLEVIKEKAIQIDNHFDDPKKLIELAQMLQLVYEKPEPETKAKQNGQPSTEEDIPELNIT